MMKNNRKEIYLILHDIRSIHNVGAVFRTADAIGVAKIFLTGYSPSPRDRFGRPRPDLAKTALGAEKTVPWEEAGKLLPLIKRLREEKFSIVALEQDKRARDYKKIIPGKKTVIVVGNEVNGLAKKIMESCDKVIEIPMRGQKESLNVATALGIALFRLFDR